MATEFDNIYGGRNGLHVSDILGYYFDWWVLSRFAINLTSPLRTGRMRIGFLSPSPCCVWEASPAVFCQTTTEEEAESASTPALHIDLHLRLDRVSLCR